MTSTPCDPMICKDRLFHERILFQKLEIQKLMIRKFFSFLKIDANCSNAALSCKCAMHFPISYFTKKDVKECSGIESERFIVPCITCHIILEVINTKSYSLLRKLSTKQFSPHTK